MVVACSGGPDSVAAVGVLHAVSAAMELQLLLAYVHHATRESAWQDECIVLRVAATLGLPVKVCALTPGALDEATLRDGRYAALLATAQALDANVIVTAHHAEDQSESVLLALARGTGPTGLAGMRPRRQLRDGIDLARPFLRFSSERLRAYCAAQALPYVVDPGNSNLDVRRNAVRAALAALRPLFPGLDAAVARAAELVGDEQDGSTRAQMRRRVRAALGDNPGLRDVEFTHVEEAVRALEEGRSGRFYMRPGVALCIEAGTLHVVQDDGC